jgi:hypothetical protein
MKTLARRTLVGLLSASVLLTLLAQPGWAGRAKIGVTISDASQPEGNSGTTPFTFTVTLDRAPTSQVSVKYATAVGTADGSDFAAISGSLSFAPGVKERTVDVLVTGDSQWEPNERFFVNLSGGGKALRVVDPQGIGTIGNDEPGSGISVSDVTVTEGDTGAKDAVMEVSLSDPATSDLTISYVTVEGTASAAGDYDATPGSVTVAAGQSSASVTVPVMGDKVDESSERFSVELSENSPTGYLVDGHGVTTIVDDDKTATATTLRIRKRSTRIVAQGNVTPPAPGQKMTVKLYRKRAGGWVLRRTKRPALSAAKLIGGASRSTYRTTFARPEKGVFRVVARYAGNVEMLASTASVRFRAG